MTRANRWLAGLNTDLDTALFATCCFVVIDPARGELTMCRAGHPAPALVVPGAAPALLEWGGGLPLGVDAAARYRTAEMTVPPGTTLVLATDGLLDADGSDPDANVRHLLRVLGEGAADDLEALTDRLLTTPQRLTRHGDDVALLVARVEGPAARA
jgi:serine phosphatase RsbU (regulator of sigma subunit)